MLEPFFGRLTSSFNKASSFGSEVNFRSFPSLGYTQKSDKSATNQLNGTNSEETLKNDGLNAICKKNPNRIIIAHSNINSIRKKFEMLKEVAGNKIDILLISETKLDNTFPLNQFIFEGFIPPYRVNRTTHAGGLMHFVREDIPSKLLPNINPSGNKENIFVEINLRSKKWHTSGSYNPNVSLIQNHTINYVKILIFIHPNMKSLLP